MAEESRASRARPESRGRARPPPPPPPVAAIPSGLWSREGPSFDPVCDESDECLRAYTTGPWNVKEGTCKCSGFSNGGPLLPSLEIVDNVQIPATLPPGAYVLQWRWDCEESDQIWASCADVTIEAP